MEKDEKDAAYYRGQAIAQIDPLVKQFRELAEKETTDEGNAAYDEAADMLEDAISSVEDFY